jgi:hypothetical protein
MGRTVIQIVVAGMIVTGLSAGASPEKIRAADEMACSSSGFQPNTPDFAACLQRQSWRDNTRVRRRLSMVLLGTAQAGGARGGIGGEALMSGVSPYRVNEVFADH